jgi:hypothetical protein
VKIATLMVEFLNFMVLEKLRLIDTHTNIYPFFLFKLVEKYRKLQVCR